MGQQTLVEHSAYEVAPSQLILFYFFSGVTCGLSLILTLARRRNSFFSVETLFRNARWLERETAEMFGLFYQGKRDRRALFTMPLFYLAPLRKSYPSTGLYELALCPILGQARFRGLNVLS